MSFYGESDGWGTIAIVVIWILKLKMLGLLVCLPLSVVLKEMGKGSAN